MNKSVKKTSNPLMFFVIIILAVVFVLSPVTADRTMNDQWIIVNPIGNHTVGEIVIINGTTNVPAGTNLTIEVWDDMCGRQGPRAGNCTYDLIYTDAESGTANPDIRVFKVELNTSGFQGGIHYRAYGYGMDLKGNSSPFFRLYDPSINESTDPEHQIRIVCTYMGQHGTELGNCSEIETERLPAKTQSSCPGFIPALVISGSIGYFTKNRKRN